MSARMRLARLGDTPRFRAVWASGGTVAEMARELGGTESGVQNAARRYGYPRRQDVLEQWSTRRIAAWIAAAPEPDPREAKAGAAEVLPETPAHPRWAPEDDVAVIRTQGRYAEMAALADRLDRPIPVVLQRWHQLRVAA